MQDITIRNASLADAPRILEIYAWYVEHTVITFEYDVPSLEEFEGRMRRTMQKYTPTTSSTRSSLSSTMCRRLPSSRAGCGTS